MCKHVSTLELNHQRDDFGVGAALFEATKHRIVEFVTELWKANPSFGFETNLDDRLAFMVAIQHRRENVFNLIYGVKQAWKAGNINKKDVEGNNILHIAGGWLLILNVLESLVVQHYRYRENYSGLRRWKELLYILD
ncbi:hypothetical protein SLE2022_153510 [Rubroshorea leprosula]